MFPAESGTPKFFIDLCKTIAERAGLRRDDWWVHKFRATVRHDAPVAGVDADVMNWIGHKNIASTMRHLKPDRSLAVRAKVEPTFSLLTA